VEFTAGGTTRRTRIDLNSGSPTYRVGQTVEVIYDPRRPSRVRTSHEANDSPRAVFLGIAALITAGILLGVGISSLRFADRAVGVLQASPWRESAFHYRLVYVGRGYAAKVRLGDGSDDVKLYASPSRTRYLRRSPSGKLWIAEDPPGKYVVLTSNAGADLFRAQRR
jgi:hypothetical protein